jgi:hypothetical protein
MLLVGPSIHCGVLGEAVADGVTYYVAKNHPEASDSNPGNEKASWVTIQHAAEMLHPGDAVFVAAGTYVEQVQMNVSGEAGNPITFKAEENSIVRGFRIHDQSYIRIIGFEITHQDSSAQHEGIHMIKTHGTGILDNYIHNVYTLGIWMYHAGESHDAVIRENRMESIGSVEGHESGEIVILVWGDNNLVEYNDISHVGDFLNVWGGKTSSGTTIFMTIILWISLTVPWRRVIILMAYRAGAMKRNCSRAC